MAEERYLVIGFMIDSPGGKRRRRAMVRAATPPATPRTITIPDSIDQTQAAITFYLAGQLKALMENITWRQPLP